ncbi:hypothetical protein RAH42_12905 [Pyramidobacter sp. YE332]|uniref:hypothetical protein n=1 Tax=Pyramidobacter sp. YE332 TaxID=3068894 RepID=UPI00294B6E83|nr:hypothetical protein [Pyramidobacter sp. YE332]WOL41333.1 hypothetical protein RAH42_12905 [Pyramidobacter sp. YE332]
MKDMGIALDCAREMKLDLPGLELADKLYRRLADEGGENDGTQALYNCILLRVLVPSQTTPASRQWHRTAIGTLSLDNAAGKHAFFDAGNEDSGGVRFHKPAFPFLCRCLIGVDSFLTFNLLHLDPSALGNTPDPPVDVSRTSTVVWAIPRQSSAAGTYRRPP